MIFHRPWLLLFVAGLLFEGIAQAQDNTGNSTPANTGGSAPAGAGGSTPAGTPAAGNGTPGASSTFGNQGATPATPAQGNLPAQGTQGQGVNPPPGQPIPGANGTNPAAGPGAGSTLPGQTLTAPDNAAAGSASSFGNAEGQAGAQLHEAPPSFTVPGFYGRGPQEFTVGEGRLARPHFRISVSASQGYDDNVLQTPTHGFNTPSEEVPVEVAGPIAPTTREVLVPSGDPGVPASLQTEQVAGVPPRFKNKKIPGVPAARRLGSWISRTNGMWDMQFANRQSLFTFDFVGGADYYWDRPGGHTDYFSTLSLIYLRKLTSRAQFTISVNSSYQTQPDFTQPNLPTSNQVGPYFVSNIKADFSYRLTPRFSTVTSVSYNGIDYMESTEAKQNFGNTTFGTELRYLFSPRMTLVGELRYSSDSHENQAALNNKTYYLLLGDEITLSRRFSTSLRLGEQVQSFTGNGGSQASSSTGNGGSEASPFAEANLTYKVGTATSVQWNARYGFEESGVVGGRNTVARTGLQVTQAFSPRLQATLSVNLIRNSTTTSTPTSTSSTTSTTPVTAETVAARDAAAELAVPADQVQDTFDATLGFYYTLSRHWSFNLTYQYSTALGPIDVDTYYRQRLFFGATYQF